MKILTLYQWMMLMKKMKVIFNNIKTFLHPWINKEANQEHLVSLVKDKVDLYNNIKKKMRMTHKIKKIIFVNHYLQDKLYKQLVLGVIKKIKNVKRSSIKVTWNVEQLSDSDSLDSSEEQDQVIVAPPVVNP